jgi:hypothetical protein
MNGCLLLAFSWLLLVPRSGWDAVVAFALLARFGWWCWREHGLDDDPIAVERARLDALPGGRR